MQNIIIIEEMKIDGLDLSDLNQELHEVIGLRTGLYPPKLANSDTVIGNEGDLGCLTGIFILQTIYQ